VSSATAPVALIGGWTLAASRQSGGFDPTRETISELAARGSDDAWVMSGALVAVGVAHVFTATALRPAADAGRLALATGGVATMLVATFPLTVGGGPNAAHTAAATVALGALAIWPAVAGRRRHQVPVLLRPKACTAATVVLVGSLCWFFGELVSDGARIGLAERTAAGAQALWPLAVVASAWFSRRRAAAGAPRPAADVPLTRGTGDGRREYGSS
jgi:hypothetical membrane protein